MKKWIKKSIKKLLLLVAILLISGIVFMARMSFRHNDSSIKETFKKHSKKVEIERFVSGKDTLRYMTTGNSDSKTAILFVHGTPGGMDMFNSVLMDNELQQNYFLISVDRLGYGYSNYGKAKTSIQSQANIILDLIESRFSIKKTIVFGHSYGAPIAAYMACKNPEQIKKIILAGGAVDPQQEKFEWLAKLSLFPLFKWTLSKDNLVASEEKIAHVKELESIKEIWGKITVPVVAMHGTKDWMVPYKNVDFLKNKIPSKNLSIITLKDESHFFFAKPEIIKKGFK